MVILENLTPTHYFKHRTIKHSQNSQLIHLIQFDGTLYTQQNKLWNNLIEDTVIGKHFCKSSCPKNKRFFAIKNFFFIDVRNLFDSARMTVDGNGTKSRNSIEKISIFPISGFAWASSCRFTGRRAPS